MSHFESTAPDGKAPLRTVEFFLIIPGTASLSFPLFSNQDLHLTR